MKRFLVLMPLLVGPLFGAPDWEQWRGPTRDSRIHEGAAKWPTRLNEENLTKRWDVSLAEGYSSPIVVGERVFTVETKGKKMEVVRAFDRKTGKPLWERSWEGAMKVPFYAAKNGSWVRSTPACDGKTLFVGGMRDVLVALDVKTGEIKWLKDYPSDEKSPRPAFGFVSSPLMDEKHIYVQVGSAMRKIRKSDGETAWKTMEDERAMFGSAFSSPTWATIAGKKPATVRTPSGGWEGKRNPEPGARRPEPRTRTGREGC